MLRQLGLVLPLVLGCGHASHHSQSATSSAGETTVEEAGQAGAPAATGGVASGAGGVPSSAAGAPSSAGQAGAAQAGSPEGATAPGAAGAADEDPLRAGTRYCESAADCLGFDCIGFGSTQASICSSACETNAGCALGELCIGVGPLSPLCLQPCQSAEDCGYGFDCVHYEDVATFCLPAPWTEQFMHPTP